MICGKGRRQHGHGKERVRNREISNEAGPEVGREAGKVWRKGKGE